MRRSAALPHTTVRRAAAVLISAALLTGLAPAPTTAVDPTPGTVADGPRLDRAGAGLSPEMTPTAFSVPNFQETVVFSGLTQPMAVDFAADGRVFVAEKSGLIKVFANLSSPTPTIWADIRTNVHDYWDRGLMGMALDPSFTSNGRLYVAYAHNAAIGGTAPRWPDGSCPNPPGGTTDGCVISGRLSALTSGGAEQVLIEDWCQQFPSHSLGDVLVGADGALYVSGGDGASFNTTDFGQLGGSLSGTPTPKNPCGDPPVPVGGTQTLPSAEGGALRSQDIRTTGDPLGLGGTVIRVNRTTGAAMPDNPAAGSGDANTRRVIAYGLRNPFRMALHPVSGELWIGDVGWSSWEEVNRHSSPLGAVRNFGWPCREGESHQPGIYNQATLCSTMTSSTPPHYAYSHGGSVVSGDGCGGGGAISGMTFYAGGSYPSQYTNALFFADYSRNCLWVMPAGTNGLPSASSRAHFASLANPVHLTTGPGGDLFYVDIGGGTIRRISYTGTNRPPVAAVSATPTSGSVPLAVSFDARASSDPDGDPLSFAWDFGKDGDGLFNDATGSTTSTTYTNPGTYVARVRVTDGRGGSAIAQVTINAGNDPPVATITQPSANLTWSVNQTISFAGTGTDPNQGTLPASAMTWQLILRHCPSDCHDHPVSTWTGVSSGSFSAPDHEYPSHLLLRLTVTDAHGATDTTQIRLDPKTVTLRLESSPTGATLTAGWVTKVAPFTMTAIAGSSILLNAPTGEVFDGFPYQWAAWSNGGARTQTIVAGSSATYRASFTGGFSDVKSDSPFRNDIGWLVRNGITSGCSTDPPRYCPADAVTRAQMATFLDRVLDLPPAPRDFFTDDNGSQHEGAINRVAAAGITAGCAPGRFCPNGPVLREQMASFLARALGLPVTTVDYFDDDDARPTHEADINRLAASGITGGCGPRRFCPTDLVTREQMAAFLRRAFADRFPR